MAIGNENIKLILTVFDDLMMTDFSSTMYSEDHTRNDFRCLEVSCKLQRNINEETDDY